MISSRYLSADMSDNLPQNRLLSDEIHIALAETPYPAIRRVRWGFDGETLVLEGRLRATI
jgi:hypothetical protein